MKHKQHINKVAVIGAGVVGRGWMPVFVGGGCETRIYDLNGAQSHAALEWCRRFLDRRVERGEMGPEEAGVQIERMRICNTLEETVAGAQYIQESIPEDLAVKRSLFTRLDQYADGESILASSTSAIDIEDIASGLACAGRCITVHPFNPAAILPVVEMMATRQAEAGFVDRVECFLKSLGQRPIHLRKFAKGYVGNRLQLALMREAINIVEDNIASTEAIDIVLSEGLALRWALLGTFGTNHTNSDLGIRGYYGAYADALKSLMNDLTLKSPTFDAEMIERYGLEMDKRFANAQVSQVSEWRDDLVSRIQTLKQARPLSK